MYHITPERIAALADEPATLPERTHLSDCVECNANLAAAQRLVHMALTETPAIERPITSWARLGPALRAEGLVTRPMNTGEYATEVTPIERRRGMRYRWVGQAAAAALLVVGGAAMGRASASLPPGTLASRGAANTQDTNFKSTTEAMNVLQQLSGQYQRAVAYLAANDSSVTLRGRDAADLYRARLDALDQSVAATRAALYRAPQDPVLNNYYIQSVGARDLTLRQMGQVVPVSSTKRTRF